MQRTFIIIAIVIVLVGAGVAAYFTYFSKSPGVTITPPSGSTSLPSAGGATDLPSTTTGTDASTVQSPTPVSARLMKISAGPVVPGEVIVDSKGTASSSAETTVSYIERQSGNVYSYAVRASVLTRTSNRTVPGIQSATWLPDASTAFVRYLSGTDLSTVNTYALPANGSGGFFLPQNLSDISVSSTSVLTLVSGVNGSIASVLHTDGSHATEVFSTPLSALHSSLAGKQYLAYTSPSATLPGAVFLVDNKGGFSRVAGPLNGLVAKASPSGKWALLSYTEGGNLLMGLINTSTGQYLPLPVATIADKCVWASDDTAVYCGIPTAPPAGYNYPDDWYQGAVSFTDKIWKIQVAGRYAQFVLDFTKENNNTPLDAEALAIDPLQSTLVFINKIDGSLWSYSL
jgi:hypothetical protein